MDCTSNLALGFDSEYLGVYRAGSGGQKPAEALRGLVSGSVCCGSVAGVGLVLGLGPVSGSLRNFSGMLDWSLIVGLGSVVRPVLACSAVKNGVALVAEICECLTVLCLGCGIGWSFVGLVGVFFVWEVLSCSGVLLSILRGSRTRR